MIARWLQAILAAEAIVLAAATFLGMPAASARTIVIAVVGGLFVLNLCAVVAIYTTLRLYAATAALGGSDSGMLRRLWSAAGECLALLTQFMTIAPFERWWMGADALPALPARTHPILLVHGYLCNRGLWWWLRRRLRANGLALATVNLEPPFASIDHFATQLHRRVEALAEETGADQVVLVTHSMGGLVARAYMLRHGTRRIAKLVTLAAPHRGTEVAFLGPGCNARQMQPGSNFLRWLSAATTPAIALVALWSRSDEFVVPHDSGRMPNAREYALPGLGHIAMTLSPTVLSILRKELTCVGSKGDQ